MTVYQKFEHFVLLILTCFIAIVITAAVWNLTLKILFSLVLANTFDPTDYVAFQTVFGMIFTVVIALEFKRSLLVVAERQKSIVQVRTVILLAMLAIVRKLIILELLQFMEKVADRRAAEQVVYHLGWKYALDLELPMKAFIRRCWFIFVTGWKRKRPSG